MKIWLRIWVYIILNSAGWAELGAPGIPRGPHLFGFYVLKESKFDIFLKKTIFLITKEPPSEITFRPPWLQFLNAK